MQTGWTSIHLQSRCIAATAGKPWRTFTVQYVTLATTQQCESRLIGNTYVLLLHRGAYYGTTGGHY